MPTSDSFLSQNGSIYEKVPHSGFLYGVKTPRQPFLNLPDRHFFLQTAVSFARCAHLFFVLLFEVTKRTTDDDTTRGSFSFYYSIASTSHYYDNKKTIMMKLTLTWLIFFVSVTAGWAFVLPKTTTTMTPAKPAEQESSTKLNSYMYRGYGGDYYGGGYGGRAFGPDRLDYGPYGYGGGYGKQAFSIKTCARSRFRVNACCSNCRFLSYRRPSLSPLQRTLWRLWRIRRR